MRLRSGRKRVDILTAEEFKKVLEETPEKKRTAQFYLNILKKHFLGDWYSTSGFVSNYDINPEAVYEILARFPRKKKLRERIAELWQRKSVSAYLSVKSRMPSKS